MVFESAMFEYALGRVDLINYKYKLYLDNQVCETTYET